MRLALHIHRGVHHSLEATVSTAGQNKTPTPTLCSLEGKGGAGGGGRSSSGEALVKVNQKAMKKISSTHSPSIV